VVVDACRGGALRLQLTFEADFVYRPVAIDLIATLSAHVAQGDRAFVHAMITAFGEAFNNVVMHGYRGRVGGSIEVDVELSPAAMVVRLRDDGRHIDFAEVRPPDLDAMPEGGMGMFMIRSLVDEVTYRAGTPNVLTLTKRASKVA
jgi:serine/threonine-protein kinase RsbW